VTSIGSGAFSGCSGLTSITLPFVGGSATATTAGVSTLFGYIFGTGSYTGGTKTVLTYLVNAAVLPSTGTIVLNVQEESNRMHTVHLDDCFKEPTTVSPKQKLRKDDARTYMSIIKISNGFTALLNELAAAKEKLYIDYKVYKRSA
jgi:hypothetical protein